MPHTGLIGGTRYEVLSHLQGRQKCTFYVNIIRDGGKTMKKFIRTGVCVGSTNTAALILDFIINGCL